MSILYGDVNPSGRLPYTIAKTEDDYGALLNSSVSFDHFPEDNFTEGLYIDYRAFDKNKIDPLFEFGFGLSYTSFGYGKFSARWEGEVIPSEFPDPEVEIIQGGHPELWDVLAVVRCAVRNTGEVAGAEVAQLYVGIPSGRSDDEESDAPVRQLRGFKRVGPLAAGEEGQVEFRLTRRDLSIWDVVAQQWRLRRGEYKLWVGASSRDLRLNGTLVLPDW